MKKYFIYTFAALMLSACSLKEDRIYSETPDQRLQQTLTQYTDLLTSSTNGWLMAIDTKASGGYALWLSFNKDYRVTMLSDMEATWAAAGQTASKLKESSYRLKAQQLPSLIFDTYSYLHMLADPQGSDPVNGNVNGGANGSGLVSDFEFDIIGVTAGVITLRGKYNKCTAYLIPATAEQAATVQAGGLKTMHQSLATYLKSMKAPIVTIDNVATAVSTSGRRLNFAYVDQNGAINELSFDAYLNVGSLSATQSVPNIELFAPQELLGHMIKGLEWNGTAYELIAEDARYTLTDNLIPPFKPDFGYAKTFTKIYYTHGKFAGTVSPTYLTSYYNAAYQTHYDTGRNIEELDCEFKMGSSGIPVMEVRVNSRTRSTGTLYVATWNVSYTTNADGTITFTDRTEANSNAQSYGRYMRGMLDIFCTVEYSTYTLVGSTYNIVKSKITPRTFRTAWQENNTPGLDGKIGSLISVDDPTLYFCGVVSK